MNEMSEKDFLELLENDKINPYSIYNFDIEANQYFSVKHYLENTNDNISKDQLITKIFLDIEVYAQNSGEFPLPTLAKYPLSIVTFYSSSTKTYFMCVLWFDELYSKHKNINRENTDDIINLYKAKLVEEKYNFDPKTENIILKFFDSELQLIEFIWAIIHKLDPAVLSGFNSHEYDYPYLYKRLNNLLNDNHDKTAHIMSKFNIINIYNSIEKFEIDIPDYPILDVQKLYKPRSEGGLNLGSSQESYSLDFLSEVELGVKKVEYKNSGDSIDQFTEKDPIMFWYYNLVDVVLCHMLDVKLKHIDLFNTLRRIMNCGLSKGSKGSSALYDTLVYEILTTKKEFVRWGIIKESEMSIPDIFVEKLLPPKSNKIIWKNEGINKDIFRQRISSFSGAYVKQPTAQINADNNYLIVDLDATSMYPSIMKQYNISFDTFYGRILSEKSYTTINMLNEILGTKKTYHPALQPTIFSYIDKYIEKNNPQGKYERKREFYIIIMYLFAMLKQNNIPLTKIFEPENFEEYLILKNIFIPLLKLIDEIHPESEEYNTLVYDYCFNPEFKNHIRPMYIVEDISSPDIKVKKYTSEQLYDYIKEKELIVTLSGCLFYKHEKKLGLFYNFLNDMYKMRKQYQKERDSYLNIDMDKYRTNDMRQGTAKIVMNTAYGLYGQSTFRYSNRWLAETVTLQGKMTLKIAQVFGENSLRALEELSE